MAQVWEIVGGVDKGGILVRDGKETTSLQAKERLSTGALVEEVELIGERLNYKLLHGSGPAVGWISVKISGKDLAVRTDKRPNASQPTKSSPKDDEPTGDEEKVKSWMTERPAYLTLVKPLPPWYKATPPEGKTVDDLFRTISSGEFYSLEFPTTVPMLGEKPWGAAWLTKAFRAAGTLPADNEVSKIVSLEEVPFDSQEIAGGAARKGLLKIEYARNDPELHTELFVKVPLMNENKENRMTLSFFGDPDGAELSANQFLVHMLPVKGPKLYFCDISRRTTNWILITERICFAKRGDPAPKPYVVHPAAAKCMDHLLPDPVGPYYALIKAMARIVALDKTGRLESVREIFEETSYARFGGRSKYLEDQKAIADRTPEQVAKAEKQEATKAKNALGRKLKALPEQVNALVGFMTQVAPWLFPEDCKEKEWLEGLALQLEVVSRHAGQATSYCQDYPGFKGLIHPNPEIDNAYFWTNDDGNYECGLFDWGGCGYQPYTRLFHGCIRSALPEVYLEHEERWFQCFSDEIQRHGGPYLDPDVCLLISRLMFAAGMADKAASLMASFRVTSIEEWKTIKSKEDERIVGRWNCKIPVLMGMSHLVIWRRGPHWQVFVDWCKSRGLRVEPPFE